MENINVNKDEKTVIKHEAKLPRYHEHVQKEEARKVSEAKKYIFQTFQEMAI